MDVCEVELQARPVKEVAVVAVTDEIARPPLVPSEKNSNAVTRKPKTLKEVPSRYKNAISSPSLSTPAGSRRCPSPNISRTARAPSPSFPRRAQSAERRRFSIPSSPPRPSTPVHDASIDITKRRSLGGRMPEGLWPSTTTIRSLSVSFQSDTFSLPVSKKEKPIHDSPYDHPLKHSANVARRQAETPAIHRKATPERKRTPLRGRNAFEQLENSKPVDDTTMASRAVDHHRWPSRKGVAMSTSSLARSVDLTDKAGRVVSIPSSVNRISPLRRMPASDNMGKRLRKSGSEVASKASLDGSGRSEYEMYLMDVDQKLVLSTAGLFSNSSERVQSTIGENRTLSLPIPGSTRAPSPCRTHLMLAPSSRGSLPRTKSLTSSPSIISTTSRSTGTPSVLSFIADIKKGKKAASYIEDAHILRLLHNRYLQWRYVNAQAEEALFIQNTAAEKTLFNVWYSTTKLRDTVRLKRIYLEQLRQELKLISILNTQITYLDNWALLEGDHCSSLAGAIEALEACTLRIPVTGGARVDLHTVRDAISSAVDLMQGLGSSMSLLLPKVEGMSHLVSELADVAAKGRAMLDECEDLLASTSALQVGENSLMTHVIQLRQAWRNGQLSS